MPRRDPARGRRARRGLGRLDRAGCADEITGVQIDSRRIEPGDLFVAVGGGAAFRRGCARTRRRGDARARRRLRRARARSPAPSATAATRASSASPARSGKTSTKDILAALCGPHAPHRRGRGELQQRARRPADALPPRARHGGLRARARRCAASARSPQLCRHRAAAHRRDHGDRPRPPRARRHGRAGRASEGGADRRAPRGRRRRSCRRTRRARAVPARDARRPALREPTTCSSVGASTATGRARDFRRRRRERRARRSRSRRATSALNALAALHAYDALGLPLDARRSGADAIEFSRWRGEELPLPGGGLLINDAYNANPISMRAALEHLATRADGRRRVAVLGDMAELGRRRARATTARSGATRAQLGVDVARRRRRRSRAATSTAQPACGRAAPTSSARRGARALAASPATSSSSRPRARWASRRWRRPLDGGAASRCPRPRRGASSR